MSYYYEYVYRSSGANSKTLEKILLTSTYIDNELINGADPINLTILKWNKIKDAYNFITDQEHKDSYYRDIYSVLGTETCALCLQAIEKYEKEYGTQKYMKDKCKMCALALIEPCPDKDSLFSKISEIIEGSYKNEKLENMSEEELHSLLGKYIDEMILRINSLKI